MSNKPTRYSPKVETLIAEDKRLRKGWDSLSRIINGLGNRVGQQQGELRKIADDLVDIRSQIDGLKKQEWPPSPNIPGSDTLRKRQALLPAPTHSAPDRFQ